jgi:ribonucleotide reductase alpha subunit
METDGSIDNELYYHSSSLPLTENIRFIFLKCGILTSGNARDTIGKISSYRNITVKKQQYVIRIPKHKTICDVLGVKSSNKFNFFEYDGKLFSRIREIKTIDYEGDVYDLNIEDNHNYLTHMGLVHNSGKRNGSFAMYLEPWHADIIKFLHAKRAQGVEEERARDLFYALWVPDLFMERVQADKMWSLMCPDECKGLSDCYGDEFVTLYEKYEKEGKYKSQIPARKLWENIVTCQIESGVPYMCYKDASNKKSNQNNIGVIKSSNLCVSGDTKIITDKGVYDILSLKDNIVNVWNGFEFSSVKIEQTGENKDLHKITFSNHEELLCTPYHKFYIQEDYRNTKPVEVRAEDLEEGMKIIKCNFPMVPDNDCEFKNAYTHGLFCADGTYDIKPGKVRQCSFSKTNNSKYCKTHMYQQNYDFSQFTQILIDNNKCQAICGIKTPKLYLYDEKKKLLKYIKQDHNENPAEDNKKITVYLPQDFQEKYFVPYNHSVNSKLRWLEGYLDGDGCVCTEKTYQTQTIQCVSTEISFIKDVKTLLNTLGCNPSIGKGHKKGQRLLPDGKGNKKLYDCKEQYRLCISACDTQNLIQIGFKPKRLVVNHKEVRRSSSRFITVKKIDKNFTKQDTYCFNEPKKHYGVFNGIITGQCAEIIQYSDDKNPSVCNLASISLKSILKNPKNVLSEIIVISKTNCFYCKLLKYFLTSRGIYYTELVKENKFNSDKIQEIQEKYGDINYKTVPQVFGKVDDNEFKFLGGFWSTWEYLRPVIDYNQLKEIAEDLTYNLNKIIDRNFYPLEGAKKSNFEHRPIGIGVQGLADMFAEMLVPFDSDLAKKINKEIFETIYYGCMKASVDLAQQDGPYASFEGSLLSKGQFQFNLWGLEDNDLSGLWEWGGLRDRVLKYGARNSLLTALMPTASSAQILGNNECFEPFTSNIYTRSTIAGEFTMINNILMKLLENIGLWNKDFENKMIYHRGSVQNITELPQDFKNVFKTVWEISQKKYIELSAERGPFICQSQSLNIWFSKPTFGALYKAHMLSWSLGLKTGSYYVRQLPASNAQRLGMSASVEKSLKEDSICDSCSA